MYRRLLLVVFGLSFATSCVPHPVGLDRSRISQPIADAQPLLQGLHLTVPVDDSDVRAATKAFVRTDVGGAPPFITAMQGEDDARRASDCLTQAVYYEARSEPVDGQRAVAQVVLNRVRDRAFPHSVCGVVYQGSERRTGCQFSFTCDGSMHHALETAAWDRARDVAQAALAGSVYAPVGSATHYHANYVMPWWAPSLTRIGAIGSHIFYRWRGALEKALAFRDEYSGSEPGIAAATTVPVGMSPSDTGVTIHYASGNSDTGATAGVARQGSVMIHRGSAEGAADVPAEATTAASATSGVRIHLGPGARNAETQEPAGTT